MKFVTLALALLLAVGSHAASLQGDAPSSLAHARSVMNHYLEEVKNSALRALNNLDDTEYMNVKEHLVKRVDDTFKQISVIQGQVSPMTDSVFATVSDATSGLRDSIMADIDSLKMELEPKRAVLRDVVWRHIADYRNELEPIMTEYQAKHVQEMEALRERLNPIMEKLTSKVVTNVEETKAAMLPIVETVRTKLTERLEQLKEMAAPYVEEYKDKIKQSYDQAQMNPEEMAALRMKITPLAIDVKDKLEAIVQVIVESVNKS